MTHAFHTDDCPQSSPDYDLTDPAVVLALVGRVRLLEAVAEAARAVVKDAGRYRDDAVPQSPSARALFDALAALDVDPPPTEKTDSGGD